MIRSFIKGILFSFSCAAFILPTIASNDDGHSGDGPVLAHSSTSYGGHEIRPVDLDLYGIIDRCLRDYVPFLYLDYQCLVGDEGSIVHGGEGTSFSEPQGTILSRSEHTEPVGCQGCSEVVSGISSLAYMSSWGAYIASSSSVFSCVFNLYLSQQERSCVAIAREQSCHAKSALQEIQDRFYRTFPRADKESFEDNNDASSTIRFLRDVKTQEEVENSKVFLGYKLSQRYSLAVMYRIYRSVKLWSLQQDQASLRGLIEAEQTDEGQEALAFLHKLIIQEVSNLYRQNGGGEQYGDLDGLRQMQMQLVQETAYGASQTIAELQRYFYNYSLFSSNNYFGNVSKLSGYTNGRIGSCQQAVFCQDIVAVRDDSKSLVQQNELNWMLGLVRQCIRWKSLQEQNLQLLLENSRLKSEGHVRTKLEEEEGAGSRSQEQEGSQLNQLESQYCALEEKHKLLGNIKTELSEWVEQLSSQLGEAELNNERQSEEIDRLKTLEASYQAIEDKNIVLAEMKEVLSSWADELRGELEETKATNKAQATEIERLKELEASHKVLEEQCSLLTDIKERLMKQLEESAKTEESSSQRELKELRQEVNSLRKALERKKSDLGVVLRGGDVENKQASPSKRRGELPRPNLQDLTNVPALQSLDIIERGVVTPPRGMLKRRVPLSPGVKEADGRLRKAEKIQWELADKLKQLREELAAKEQELAKRVQQHSELEKEFEMVKYEADEAAASERNILARWEEGQKKLEEVKEKVAELETAMEIAEQELGELVKAKSVNDVGEHGYVPQEEEYVQTLRMQYEEIKQYIQSINKELSRQESY